MNIFVLLSLAIITGKQSFSTLSHWFFLITPEKKGFNIFTAKSESFSFKFCNVLQIFKYQFSNWFIY